MKFFIALILSLSFSIQGFTSEPLNYSDILKNIHERDQSQDSFYQHTLELCADQSWFKTEFFKSSFKATTEVFMLNTNTAAALWDTGWISPELYVLLESEGFYRALSECKTQYNVESETLLKKLFVADAAGRSSGFAATYFGLRIFGKVTARIGQRLKIKNLNRYLIGLSAAAAVGYLAVHYGIGDNTIQDQVDDVEQQGAAILAGTEDLKATGNNLMLKAQKTCEQHLAHPEQLPSDKIQQWEKYCNMVQQAVAAQGQP